MRFAFSLIVSVVIFAVVSSSALAANCTNREPITSACECDGVNYSSGYCCYYDPAAGNITWQTTETCGYTKWSPHWEHIKLGVVHYTHDPPEPPEVKEWVGQNFDIIAGGENLMSYNPMMKWATYLDLLGPSTIPFFIEVKDNALNLGLNFEEGVTHVLTDTVYPNYASIRYPDVFGIFEPNRHYGQYAREYYSSNGVIAYNSGVYYDLTNESYSTTSNDVPFCQATNDYLYMGYEEPFDEVNFVPGTVGSFSYSWEYYDGNTWQSLGLSSDTTNSLTQTGTIRFIPPGDWDVSSVNNNRAKFFIRINCLSVSSAPTASRFYGYDYYQGNPGEYILSGGRYDFLLRGWDYNDPNIITVTSRNILYNPTPPSNANARFRYWSRLPFSVGFAMNTDPNNASDKFLVWTEGVINRSLETMSQQGSNGMMFDDASRTPGGYSGIPSSNIDWGVADCWTIVNRNKYIYNRLKGIDNNFYLGQNNYRIEYLDAMDYQLRENIVSDTKALGTFFPIPYIWDEHFFTVCQDTYTGGYDNYRAGTADGFMMYAENVVSGWDSAERGPMNALSIHYIGMNDYTQFVYHSHGDWNYGREGKGVECNDGFFNFEFNCTGHGGIKQYNSWFPAITFDIGEPTSDRYVWKDSGETGGAPIYRRNYTNTIVVLRAGNNNEQFSPSFDLGETIYRLRADGSLDSATNTISLRQAEGTILIKQALPTCTSDTNNDNKVNIIDLVIVIFHQGIDNLNPDWDDYDHLDVNNDTVINFADVSTVISSFGQSC